MIPLGNLFSYIFFKFYSFLFYRLGEDGPTHQPVEMLESLRCLPNMHVFRPADGNEVIFFYLFIYLFLLFIICNLIINLIFHLYVIRFVVHILVQLKINIHHLYLL